jgi:hypothetical protein
MCVLVCLCAYVCVCVCVVSVCIRLRLCVCVVSVCIRVCVCMCVCVCVQAGRQAGMRLRVYMQDKGGHYKHQASRACTGCFFRPFSSVVCTCLTSQTECSY